MERHVGLGCIIETAVLDSSHLGSKVGPGFECHRRQVTPGTPKRLALDDGPELDEVAQLSLVTPQPVVDETLALPSFRISHIASPPEPSLDVAERFEAAHALPQHRPRDAQL